MKILLWNINYAQQMDGSVIRYFHFWRFLFTRSIIKKIQKFIEMYQPDVVGLCEIDAGSALRGDQLPFNWKSIIACKYRPFSLYSLLPIFKFQSNAFLTKKNAIAHIHYFGVGSKQLLLEMEYQSKRFFLVHLDLLRKNRVKQLYLLHKFAAEKKPDMIMGDMNCQKEELSHFHEYSVLKTAPTYPSKNPRVQIDYILVRKGITVKNIEVLQSNLSDHLPIIIEIDSK